MGIPIAGKLDQLRDAQRTGFLDPAWEPVDVLALINQIAMTWAGQPEIAAAAADQAVAPPSPPAAPHWWQPSSACSLARTESDTQTVRFDAYLGCVRRRWRRQRMTAQPRVANAW
ncbi:hypothetical protein [Streptomyces halstedii]|uniref:hypothetical protein n=1 Tax=Streptomyces halstedii TaxID=1944 RepID=UPI00335C3E5A